MMFPVLKDWHIRLDGAAMYITEIISWLFLGKVKESGKKLKIFRIFLLIDILVRSVQYVISAVYFLLHPKEFIPELKRNIKLEDSDDWF